MPKITVEVRDVVYEVWESNKSVTVYKDGAPYRNFHSWSGAMDYLRKDIHDLLS
jgi:hypothetical protein